MSFEPMRQDPWANGAPACWIGFGPNGVSHYRTYMPAQHLQGSMFVRHEQELTVIKQLGVLEEPIAIYSMPYFTFQVAECAQIIEAGQRLIVDVDDYLRGFLDKKDAYQADRFSPEAIDMHEELLKKATLVTTSTQWIADAYAKRLGVECVVCPNALDMDRFNIRRFPRKKEFTVIGWSGAAGHLQAFEEIVIPTINHVLKERDDVLFGMVGNPDPELSDPIVRFDESIRERCYAQPFVPIYQHATLLQQFHISLAPAIADDFYRAKSNIRYLEGAASFSASVVSDTTYGETVRRGEEFIGETVGIVCGSNSDEWTEAVMGLLADPKGRDRMGRKARAYVVAQHTMENTAPQWTEAINRALEKQ